MIITAGVVFINPFILLTCASFSFNLSLTDAAVIFAAQDLFMRKIALLVFAFATTLPALAQDSLQNPIPVKNKMIVSRSGDHLMLQLASNSWVGAPDSIKNNMKSFNRSANVYFMLNKPFKSDPRLSFAFGLGIGTSNIYFKEMEVDIASPNGVLPFVITQGQDHFKKYKLTTALLEVPVEFRFTSKPDEPLKALKFAIGAKVGTLLNVHTKGKNLVSSSGANLNSYTQKVSTKSYFNSTRLSGTFRAGYGAFSLFGSYGFTNIFKDGVAEPTNLLQIGLCFSGL